MSTPSVTRLAMAAAGVMLAHQVASKAFRDAAFLTVWPAEALPLMIIGAAVAVVAAVPVFARLLETFGPRFTVPAGFVLSAIAHVIEWRLSSAHPWVAVLIYLHVAGLGALLLSGYWSLVSERFDPRGARASFGRIAAAGTIGGALGGLAAERMAVALPADSVLLFLAGLHIVCAATVLVLGRTPVLMPATDAVPSDRVFAFHALRTSPHLRTIALIVLLTTAAATVLDYLLKWHVDHELGDGANLLRFFAIFYAGVQIATFAIQAGTPRAVEKLGIGRTIATLPAGVAVTSAAALLLPVWQVIIVVRGIESMLRGSLFRSGYELLFVPMDAAERRRMKTFLDVTCDRAGEAVGAAVAQVFILITAFAAIDFLTNELLAVTIVLAGAALWFGRRLDRLYLGVVEQQLAKHADLTPVIVGSETGWTVVNPVPIVPAERVEPKPARVGVIRREDPRVQLLSELRSGDRARVEAALARLSNPDRMQVAQVVQLLAWDDLVDSARRLLERIASEHVGLLVDVLLDPDTDFAVRRRIPRILATVPSDRAIDGLVRGLDDSRFEVRYQCGRAIDRLLSKNEGLRVDSTRIVAVVERELSVPLQIWQGYRLIDRADRDDDMAVGGGADLTQRNLEHVFSLLTAVLPREPLQVALRGIRSPNAGLRGLALEYLESVLPPAILARLWQVVDAPPHAAAERTTPERALEQLRASADNVPPVKRPSNDGS